MAAQDEEAPNDAWLQSVIPVLPTPAATTCLVLNVALPGSGTLAGGLCLCCCGTPRMNGEEVAAARCCAKNRVLMSAVSVVVGVAQFLSVIFCLVGWLWSIAWGVIMATLAGVGQEGAHRKRRARKSKMAKGKTNVKVSDSDTTGQKNFKRLMLKVQETGGDIKPAIPEPISAGGRWAWRPQCWTERTKGRRDHQKPDAKSPATVSALVEAGDLGTTADPKVPDANGLLPPPHKGPSTKAYFFKT